MVAGYLTDRKWEGETAPDIPWKDSKDGAKKGRLSIFVPSFYGPRMLNGALTSSGPLLAAISKLENDRQDLYKKANTYVGRFCIADATTNAATISRIDQNVTAVSGLVDSFETSVLGGSSQNTNGGGSPSGNGGSPGGASGAATNPGTPSSTPSGGGNPGPSAMGIAAVSQPIPLTQLLLLDHLLEVLRNRQGDVYLVAVHALDSGGTSLTASGLFGSRVAFSGGVGAAYAIFRDSASATDSASGEVQCSGDTYAYRGFVQAKDIAVAVADRATPSPPRANGERIPAVTRFTSSGCGTTDPNVVSQP